MLSVPKGIDKPYFDLNGVIWLKSGADKRRVNSKEELRRLFQSVDLLHAEEVSGNVGVEAIDRRNLSHLAACQCVRFASAAGLK